MNTAKKSNKEKICGKDKSEIRTAYFKSKLPEMLADIQANQNIGVPELAELKEYLEELRSEDSNVIRVISEVVPDMEEEGSVPDEVLEENLSEEDKLQLERDRSECDKAVKLANKVINRTSANILLKRIPDREEVINNAMALLGLQGSIDKDEIFKDRLYHKKIAEYMKGGRSRRESEDFAKMSVEYRDYQLDQKLNKRIDNFIMIAKKMYDKEK